MSVHLGYSGSFTAIFEGMLDGFICHGLEFQRLSLLAHLNGANPGHFQKFGRVKAAFFQAIEQDFLVLGCIVRNECDWSRANKLEKIVQDFRECSAFLETFK